MYGLDWINRICKQGELAGWNKTHALTKVLVQTPQKQGAKPKENTTGKKKQEITSEELCLWDTWWPASHDEKAGRDLNAQGVD